MTARKTIVCRCEDVTLKDIEQAIALGYDDIESVKRYTGLGTGPCQGKECMALVAQRLAAFGTPAPFTTRPPLEPTPLRLFAAVPPDTSDDREPPK